MDGKIIFFFSKSVYKIFLFTVLVIELLILLQYPHVFEEPVLENIKAWVIDDHDIGRKKASDSEMRRTYSTGLLAVSLTG